MCLLGIAFDPATTITRKRRVGGYMDYEGAGYTDGAGGEDTYGSGGERMVKVKRPRIGFKCLKVKMDTPEHLEDVWDDGFRYEVALWEI